MSDEGITGTITHIAGAGEDDVYFVQYRSDFNSLIWHSSSPFSTVNNSGIYIPHRVHRL